MHDLNIELADYDNPAIIKVIGVGGGGDNAVGHMFLEGNIPDVRYVVCNTDKKALDDSPIPDKLQLGPGWGAGGDPVQGRELAERSTAEIEAALDDCKMVFITAGMGGGTGTGASPIIARAAKKRGLLTVGIVTIPFLFERERQIDKALDGLEALAAEVDAILVINNERLREIYADLNLLNAFKKADEVLTVAVRSIVEIITMHGKWNLDFHDVNTVLRNGGVALMSTGYGEGPNRLQDAIDNALTSPLLNHNDVYNSRKLLVLISFSAADTDALKTYETNDIHRFMSRFPADIECKFGIDPDASLGSRVKVTLLASGFGVYHTPEQPRTLNLERRHRIDDYYGALTGHAARPKRFFHIYDTAELDDEALIAAVDASPTARRRAALRP